MNEKTDWTPKNESKDLHTSTPSQKTLDNPWLKAGIAIAAGIIVAALAKGVKDSDYYD